MLKLEAKEGRVEAKTALSHLDVAAIKDLRWALENTCREGDITEMVINLSEVENMDSASVAELLAFHKDIQGQERQLVLHNPSPEVLSILELMRLHRVFNLTF